MQLRRSSIFRGVLLVAAMSVVAAACGGGGRTTEQGASQAPASTQPATTPPPATTPAPTSSADPLQGEWRTEFGCEQSVEAIQRRLTQKQVLEQIGTWKGFLEVWGGKPTKDDLCHGASGKVAFVARFLEGSLALCDETGECEVNATYELVGDGAIRLNDPQGNLCTGAGCETTWRFKISGQTLTFHVQRDAYVLGLWEAAPWTRES